MNIEKLLHQSKFSSPFQRAVLNVMVTADFLGSGVNATLKPFGISKEQYNVLRILKGQHPKPATIQLITERMISKSSNATRLVEKMRLKGLVERQSCAMDRRKVDVIISEKGLELLLQVNPLVEAGAKRFDNLSDQEVEELNRLLDKMRG